MRLVVKRSTSCGSNQGKQPGVPEYDPIARVGALLDDGLSDRSYKHLIDFYQTQVQYYTSRQESSTILGRMIDGGRPDPRELAWEDLQRVAEIYRELAGTGSGDGALDA